MRSKLASLAASLTLFCASVSQLGCGRLPAGFTNVCDGTVPLVAAGVTGVPAYDSVEVFDDGVAVDSTGSPCATATNGDCRAAYERAKQESGRRFVATRKDEVLVRQNITYVELGGTVDTEQEAAMAVFARTFASLCTNEVAVGAKAVENGFEVVLVSEGSATCARTSESRIRVERNGAVGAPVTKTEGGFACPSERLSAGSDDQDNTFEE